jgi:hypothetical protein
VTEDAAYLAADAADRRAALAAAVDLASHREDVHVRDGRNEDGDAQYVPPEHVHWLSLADSAYRWLRNRSTLHAVRVQLVPGTPHLEGTANPMTTTFTLDDTDQVEFTLTGLDAKGASVALDSGFTAAWTLADPDSTGAVLTVSADTTTATVAAGVPDSSLLLSVVVTNPDGSTLSGAEAIVVQATAAATVGLVAGTPAAETSAAPAATAPAS